MLGFVTTVADIACYGALWVEYVRHSDILRNIMLFESVMVYAKLIARCMRFYK